MIGSLWLASFSPALAGLDVLPPTTHPTDYEKNWSQNLGSDIKNDFLNYMDPDNLILFGDSVLFSGVIANTGMDRAFRQHWQTDIRSNTTDQIFALPQTIGGLSYWYAPIYIACMSVGHMRDHTLVGNVLYHFGYRSLRTFIVGGLQQVLLTNLFGSGRPDRGEDSKWQPFKYETGVSGHAFYGAVPFLTAAMMTDTPGIKYTLYVLSTLPGISRVNSDRHYLSQVVLGWTIAMLSAQSVYQTDEERSPAFQMGVIPKSDGAMLAARLQF